MSIRRVLSVLFVIGIFMGPVAGAGEVGPRRARDPGFTFVGSFE